MSDAPLMLSVSGARGIVGDTMTPEFAADFAAAFGSFVHTRSNDPQPIVCVGRDSRPSGESLAAAVMNSLSELGCRVNDLGIVATPTVAVMIAARSAAGAVGGLVVTASHNPIEWNGLKMLIADGPPIALPAHDVQDVIERWRNRTFEKVRHDERGAIEQDFSGTDLHVQRALTLVDTAQVRAVKLKVVLDSINGAGCVGGRMLLESLGCEVVHINGEPTGQFAHPPEPLEENLRDLAQATAKEKAACGFAQDPDADRLAIVDETGRYIGEEYTLVLAAKRLFDTRGGAPVAVNLSTSRMIDDLAARYPGASVIRTAVGEANVAAAMREHDAMMGGEGNGGVIVPQVCLVRDSLAAMTLVLDLLAAERKPLSAIVGGLPRYVMVKRKFDAGAIGGRAAIDAALAAVRLAFANERINDADGVRIDFADGWVHLRPSNTEPIIRLIAEAKTKDRAAELVRRTAAAAGLAPL